MSLTVLISDPERRKERTDSDANDREVYIAGLSKFVTKEDLEKLFKTVRIRERIRARLLIYCDNSTVKLRKLELPLTRMAVRKGLLSSNLQTRFVFLFISTYPYLFEQQKDAMNALNANNFELKKRRIAVTLADTRVRNKNRYVLVSSVSYLLVS